MALRKLSVVLPAVSALRLVERPALDEEYDFFQGLEADFSVGSSLGYDRATHRGAPKGNSSSNATMEWPDNWMVAHEHGHFIAHLLDEETLFNFTHAFTGPPEEKYEAETMALPAYGIPALKMQHADPGWRSRSLSEERRVTAFPSYLALASTWDKGLVYDVANAVAEEFKTLGANVMLGPNINIHRSTQHDNEFDSLAGEDPTLGSILVRQWILAVQTHGIMSVPLALGKAEQSPVHFENASSNMTAWDIYYPVFETAIDCGAAGLMCASHEVNGLWSCRDQEMLERDLKGIMGFHGMVMSDSGTAREYFPYASSFEKGLDLALNEPEIIPRSDHMVKGMRKAATRVIAAIWHSRLEVTPGCQPPDCKASLALNAKTDSHLAVAKRAAGSAIVLLQNHQDFLPLDPVKEKRVAVIGPGATRKWHVEQGSGHDGFEYDFETPWHAIASEGKRLGFEVMDSTDNNVDICVVIGGSFAKHSHWKLDRLTLESIGEAIEECSRIAVFLELSGAVNSPWKDQVAAIAAVFHAGMETAFGWASILFGDSTPSGKLPIGFPDFKEEGVPEWWQEVPPSYWDSMEAFAYPFGHGLSYASFLYSEPKQKAACHFPLCVMLTITNSHEKYSGAEVVQVYFQFAPEVKHPTVLRAFHKTKVLAPGESEKVFFPFTYRDLSLYHDVGNHTEAEKSWMPQEVVTLRIGSSVQDIRQELTVYPRYG